jgi:hypothetical protein
VQKKTIMSWDAYVTNLTATGAVSEGGVFGIDGSTWAASPSLASVVTAEELRNLSSGFLDDAYFPGNGIRVGGKKYFFIKKDSDIVTGKQGW